MWKITSARSWFNLNRIIDTFIAYSDGGLRGFRYALSEIVTFVRPGEVKKPKSLRPSIMVLEEKSSPTSLMASYGLEASILGATLLPSDPLQLYSPSGFTSAPEDSFGVNPNLLGTSQASIDDSPPPSGGGSAPVEPPQSNVVPSSPSEASRLTNDLFLISSMVKKLDLDLQNSHSSGGAEGGGTISAALEPESGGGSGGTASGPVTGGDGSGGTGSATSTNGPDVGAGGSSARQTGSMPVNGARQSANLVSIVTSSSPTTSLTGGSTTPAAQHLSVKQMAFEMNVGQTNSQAKYLARGDGYTLFLTNNQAVLTLARLDSDANPKSEFRDGTSFATRQDVIALTFNGANQNTRVVPREELDYRTNYFKGHDPDNWHSNVPNFGRVRVENLYDGISVEYYGTKDGKLEYDLIVQPGADLDQISMSFQGATATEVDASGNLKLQTSGGKVTLQAPVLYQLDAKGHREPVAGHFNTLADSTIGFGVGEFDATRTLVIDPVLEYSSYLGGDSDDFGNAIAVDGNGNAYVTGLTVSTDFPTLSPFQECMVGSADVFVTKFNQDGTGIYYSTYLGGNEDDFDDTGFGIAVDLAGNAYVTGGTSSDDFPTTPGAYLESYGGGQPVAFVTKLNSTGNALLYSTFLYGPEPSPPPSFMEPMYPAGPSNTEPTISYAIAVNFKGEAVVTGETVDDEFPTSADPIQDEHIAEVSAFLTQFNAEGSDLLYSTLLGKEGSTAIGTGVAYDRDSNIYATGFGEDIQTTDGAFEEDYQGGGSDAYALKINAESEAVYVTMIGGEDADYGRAITVDGNGYAYITGETASDDFPIVSGGFQETYGGAVDAFVTKVNLDGSALVYSTYLGGDEADEGHGIAVTRTGRALIIGNTDSNAFPLLEELDGTSLATDAIFVSQLSADGEDLLFSTPFGVGIGSGIARDLLDNAYIAGSALAVPTTDGAFQTSHGGGSHDAFAARIMPGTPRPKFASIAAPDDTGASDSDEVTFETEMTIEGTAVDNATVKIYKGGVYLANTMADGSGDWSYAATLAEGTHSFTATATSENVTSDFSIPFLVTVDLTDPEITLIVPEETYSLAPEATVYVSDDVGFADDAEVTIDVDLDGDHDFEGGELDYANGTLFEGYAVIELAGLSIDIYDVRARVVDLAGNDATSSVEVMEIEAVPIPWDVDDRIISLESSGDALLFAGALRLVHPLDLDISPGTSQSDGAALIYNSNRTDVRPIIQVSLQLPNQTSLPSTFEATLTFDGNEQDPVEYSTTGFDLGDVITIAVQVETEVTVSGRYNWSLLIDIPGEDPLLANETTYIQAANESSFGAGWSLSILNQLVEVSAEGDDPAGVIWNYGDGTTRFFEEDTGGEYIEPPEVFGELVKSGGSWTYTAPDNTTLHFNSSGYQTDRISSDGFESIEFTYDGTYLDTMTADDGAVTTFSLPGGVLSSIATAGSRTWTFDTSGYNIIEITDPDGRVRQFEYDSNFTSRITKDTRGELETNWVYDEADGLISKVIWGNDESPSFIDVVPAAKNGLADPSNGIAIALSTDALSHTTTSYFDSKGRILDRIDPNGAAYSWSRYASGLVHTATDPLGRTTTWTRDSDGYVTAVAYPGNIGNESYTYTEDEFHNVETYTDGNSNTTEYAYDGNGQLASVTNALTKVTDYTFSSGLLVSVEDPLGQVTIYGYDGSRRQDSVTTVLGETAFTFDSTTGEIETITDAATNVTSMDYDAMGRMTLRTTPDTVAESWSFNSSGLLETQTDRLGAVSTPTYDPFKRGLVVVSGQSATGISRSTETKYDNAGRAIKNTDFMGNWTTYTLDSVGRTIAVTDSLGNATQNKYDPAGQLEFSVDQLGNKTEFGYNARGWATSTIDGRVKTWSTTFNGMGQITSSTNPESNSSTTSYNALNQAYSFFDGVNTSSLTFWDDGTVKDQTDGAGIVTRTTRNWASNLITITQGYGGGLARDIEQTVDDVGNVIEVEDALDHAWTFTPDEMGRIEADSDPLTHGNTYTFNNIGQVLTSTDETSNGSTNEYDGLGRRRSWSDGSGLTVTDVFDNNDNVVSSHVGGNNQLFFHNAIGQRTFSVDGNGGVTRYGYDPNGQLHSLTDPLGNTTAWEYDRAGNKTKEIDPRGEFRTWTYDDAGRVEVYTDKLGRTKTYAYLANGQVESETWSGGNEVLYTYDGNGNLESITDDNGNFEYTYDGLGRLETYTDTWGTTATITYDAGDRIDTIEDTLGGEWTYHFDIANRLEEKEFTDGVVSFTLEYDYYDNNWLQEIRRKDDMDALVGKTLYTYDEAGRVESITHKDGSNVTLDSFTYTHDNKGNVATEASTLGPSKTYTYDAENQVTGDGSETWNWDANGNNAAYTIEARNELADDGTWTYTYNDEGSLTQKVNGSTDEIWTYGYDHNNRLVLAEHKDNAMAAVDLRVQNKYDPLGNRIQRTLDADGDGGGSATVEKYSYDQFGNAIADLSSGGSLTTRRIYEDAVDALTARITSSTLTYYLTDNLGSVRDLMDADGDLIDHLDYTTFGKLDYESASGSDRYLWTAREYDAELDLQYNRARYYDANTGRWISQDPLGFDAGDSNLYRYSKNNPTTFVDPFGLDHVPSQTRGSWSGKVGNSTFTYKDTVQNREAGLVGKKIKFVNGCIPEGGFPASTYWKGDHKLSRVKIAEVKGTSADFTAADEKMRAKYGQNWRRPAGYTWHHCGDVGETTLELVETGVHSRVPHSGSARLARASLRITGKVAGVLDVYGTFRELCQATGAAHPDFEDALRYTAYFDAGESVFIVRSSGFQAKFLGLGKLVVPVWQGPSVLFVAGPKKGKVEFISNEEYNSYITQNEELWGKVVYRFPYKESYFIPGSQRDRVPIQNNHGHIIGEINEDGYRFYNLREPRPLDHW